MTLSIRSDLKQLQTGGNPVVQVLSVQSTDSDHNFTDIYEAVTARSEVSGTRIERDNGRTYTFTNTGPNHVVISINGQIREERPGETHVICNTGSNNRDVFFQLWGTDGRTDSEQISQRTDVNVGLERNGLLQGWVRVTNNCPSIYNHSTGTDGVRPFDKRTFTGLGSADKYFAIAGLGAGSFNTPNLGVPAFILELGGAITYGISPPRFDVDILPGGAQQDGMSRSLFTMAAVDNVAITGNNGVSRIGEFVHSEPSQHMQLGQGSYLYMARTVQKQDYNVDSELDPTVGRYQFLLPESYPINFTQRIDSELTFAIFPGGGGGSLGFNKGNIVYNYPVAKIVPDGWGQARAQNLGDTEQAKYTTHYIVNSPGADRFPRGIGVRFIQGAAGQGAGALIWANAYNVRMQNVEGTQYGKGAIIRHRIDSRMQPPGSRWINTNNRGYVGDRYLLAGHDWSNHQYTMYTWAWNPSESKNGFPLQYFLSPPQRSGVDNITAGTLRGGQVSYTGDYDTWLITPGAQAQKLTLTPYTGDAVDQNRNLTFTGNQWEHYDSDNLMTTEVVNTFTNNNQISFPLNYSQMAIRNAGAANATMFVNTLLTLPYTRCLRWSNFSESAKGVAGPTTLETGTDGEFYHLTQNHEANLVTPVGNVATLSGVASGLIGSYNVSVSSQLPADNNIQVLAIPNGEGFFTLNTTTWESTSVDLKGFYIHNQATNTPPVAAAAQMSGNRNLSQGVRIALTNDTTTYYRFEDCAIATGESFTINVTGGNANSRLRILGAPSGVVFGDSRVAAARAITLNANAAGLISLIDSDDGTVIASATGTSLTQDVTGLGDRFVGVISGANTNDARVWIDAGVETVHTLPNAAVNFDATAFSSAIVVNNIYDSDSENLTVEISNARGGDAPSTAGTNNLFRSRILGTVPYNRMIADNELALGTIGVDTESVASVNGRHIEFIPGQNNDQSMGYVAAANSTPFTREVNGFIVNFASDPPVGLTIAQVLAALQDYGVATDSDVSQAELTVTTSAQAVQADIADLSRQVDSDTYDIRSRQDSDFADIDQRFATLFLELLAMRSAIDSDTLAILNEMASDSDQNADLIANVQVDVGELIVDNSAVLDRLDSDLQILLQEMAADSDAVGSKLTALVADVIRDSDAQAAKLVSIQNAIISELAHDSEDIFGLLTLTRTAVQNIESNIINQISPTAPNTPISGQFTIRHLINLIETQTGAAGTDGTLKNRVVDIQDRIGALTGVDSDSINSLATALVSLDSDIAALHSRVNTDVTSVVTNIQTNVNDITPRIQNIDSDTSDIRTAQGDQPTNTDLTRARNVILGRISSI